MWHLILNLKPVGTWHGQPQQILMDPGGALKYASFHEGLVTIWRPRKKEKIIRLSIQITQHDTMFPRSKPWWWTSWRNAGPYILEHYGFLSLGGHQPGHPNVGSTSTFDFGHPQLVLPCLENSSTSRCLPSAIAPLRPCLLLHIQTPRTQAWCCAFRAFLAGIHFTPRPWWQYRELLDSTDPDKKKTLSPNVI